MKVSILGLGAFGIAISKALYKNGNDICMWTKFEDELENVKLIRENSAVLPGVIIDDAIQLTTNMKECVENSEVIFIAVPAGALRGVSTELSNVIKENQNICIVTKGIENGTNKYMSEVVEEVTGSNNICILSGPSFAIEVANDNEIGFVIASYEKACRQKVTECLESDKIIINETSDVIGVQICAAVKNVFAIISGMVDGLEKSDSTRAAVLTCLVNDFRMIITALGGKENTIYSYAGIGDMLLTCMSDKSRNYTFGKYIAKDKDVNEALMAMTVTTVEGLYTLGVIHGILKEKQIFVKSIDMLYDIVYNNKKVDNILNEIKY